VAEPGGDVLVLKHVDQLKVGAVLARPDPVPCIRPAEARVQQGKVARGEHHLVVRAEPEAGEVLQLHLADQGEAGDRGARQVLDVNHVQRSFGKPPTEARLA
jgi:hypothetical protein